jgi:hypothetical protein
MNSSALCNLNSRQSFLLLAAILKQLNKVFFTESRIDDTISNTDIFYKYLTKTKFKKLRGNLNGCAQFLSKLVDKKETPYLEILKKKRMIHDWQQVLSALQMKHYGARRDNDEWINYSLALHNLLDIYYHIFNKFLANQSKAKCFWCQENLGLPWRVILEKLIFDRVPKTIIYLNGVFTPLSLKENPSEFLETCFEDVKFLMRNSIK